MSEHKSGGDAISCYADSKWLALAAGTLPPDEAEVLLAHAGECEVCSEKLARSLCLLHQEPTPDEDAMLATLNTSKQEWQRTMGVSLAARAAVTRPWQTRWLAVAAALTVVLGGGAIWMWRQQASQPPFAQLAEAYTERRELELRFPGSAYAPLRSVRGADQRLEGSSLLEAEARIARDGRAHPNDERWMLARGRAQILRWNPTAAIATLQAALEASPESADLLSALAMSWFESGEASGNTENFGKAAELYSRVLQKNAQDQVARFNRAIVYEKLQMFREASADWEAFLNLESSGGWADEARSHLEADRGKLSRSGDRPAVLEPGDPAVLKMLLDAARNRAELTSLGEDFERRYGDVWLKTLLTGWRHPNFSPAIETLDRAVTANIGGDPVRAAEQARLAAALFEHQSNLAGAVRAQYEILYAMQRSSNAPACRETGNRLAARVVSLGYFWLHTQTLLDLASCSNMLNDFATADGMVRSALAEDELHGFSTQRLRALGIRAVGLRAIGRWKEAWRLDAEGLRVFWNGQYPQVRAYQFYEDMGLAAEANRDFGLAAALSREAAAQISKIGNRSVEAMVREELGRRDLLAGEAREAEEEFAHGEQIFGGLAQDELTGFYRAESEIGIARAQVKLGKAPEALNRLKTIEPRIAGFRNQIVAARYYRALAEAQRATADLAAEARAWNSLVEIAEAGIGPLLGARDRLEWAEELRDAYRGVVRCALESDQPERALDAWLSYRTADFRSRRASAGARKLAQRLTRSTRVTYAQLDDGVAAWSYDDRGIVYRFVRVPLDLVDSMARRFAANCADPSSAAGDMDSLGRRIYTTLLSPLIASWDPARTLILDVDGPPGQIPFEAIPLPEGGFLSDRFTLEFGPGIDERREPNSTLPESAMLLAVGSPRAAALDTALFPPLPDAMAEAENAARLFPNHILLTEGNATPSAVRRALSTAAIFHFAGHAVSSPAQTGLVLAPEKNGGAAFLSARDLTPAALPKCRIAVLSACSTAGMKDEGPAESDSLPRALLTADVRQIVASRWPVDSRTTRELMARFYSELKRGAGVAAALQKANQQLRGLAGNSHPYYWSAFTVIGDS